MKDRELGRGRITLVFQFRKLRLGAAHRAAHSWCYWPTWCLCALGRYSPHRRMGLGEQSEAGSQSHSRPFSQAALCREQPAQRYVAAPLSHLSAYGDPEVSLSGTSGKTVKSGKSSLFWREHITSSSISVLIRKQGQLEPLQ